MPLLQYGYWAPKAKKAARGTRHPGKMCRKAGLVATLSVRVGMLLRHSMATLAGSIVKQYLMKLMEHGVKQEDIGIISPYHKQCTRLRYICQGQGF